MKISKVYIESSSHGQDCILVKAVAELVNEENVRVGNITSTGKTWNVKHEPDKKYYYEVDQMNDLVNLIIDLKQGEMFDIELLQKWFKDNLK